METSGINGMKKNIKNIVEHSEVSEKEIEKYLCKRMKEVCFNINHRNED